MKTVTAVIAFSTISKLNLRFNSVEEAAQRLGLSVASVYNYINTGREYKNKRVTLDWLYTEADAAADKAAGNTLHKIKADLVCRIINNKPDPVEEIFGELARESDNIVAKAQQYRKLIKQMLDSGKTASEIRKLIKMIAPQV